MASATHSKTCAFSHFLGAAIGPEFAGLAENSGTAGVLVGQEGGVVTLATGTSSGNRAQVHAGVNWKASSGGIFFEARVKNVSAITTRALYVGLTDTVSQENPIEISGTTVTSNASDAAGFFYDTDATTDVWYYAGVKADVDTALGTVSVGGVSVAPVADTWATFGIEIDPSGNATFYYNGVYQGRVLNAVTPGTLLTPIVLVEARTTAAQTAYVDYIDMCGAVA